MRVTITLWNTAVITRLFLGGSAVSKSPPEREEQLVDCAELDDKTSWFREVAMLLPFPIGRWVNFAPKNVSVGFKTQKTQRSIQELLLNTKISGINGQKTLFFCCRNHARTLSILCLSKQLALQHGVAMRYPSMWLLAAKGLLGINVFPTVHIEVVNKTPVLSGSAQRRHKQQRVMPLTDRPATTITCKIKCQFLDQIQWT